WHIQSGTAQSIISEDQQWCGNIDEPCESIEYALMQISIRIGGNETSFIYQKMIGITESKLTIPIIYIEGSNSYVDLNSLKFSGINLSPTSEAKGIIHINIDETNNYIQDCIFQNIDIVNKGGNVIRLLNEDKFNFTVEILNCKFINISSIDDSYGKGGSAIYAEIRDKSKIIIEDGCQFMHCVCNRGNGGAIYIDVDFTTQFEFQIKDALIKECQAKADTTSSYPTGYGGGIFLAGIGDYDPQSNSLNFKGLNISNNSADNGGQSIYIIMNKLKEWCRYGTAGEYAKGNYSDTDSNENELQGIPISFEQFLSLPSDQIQLIQKSLKYYWALPYNEFWHIQSGTAQSIISEDQQWCGNIDEPQCQAKADSTSSYPIGYGGGIFLTGSGDFRTLQNLLYFKGLKMYGNTANNGGQSLYVAMTNVVEWCKYGTDGEYVKGNYSDAYSNLSDIEGIAVNQSTFKILTQIEIQSQQQSLQYYWAHLATLSYINTVLNESNIDQPLHFIIKGSNMIPGKLCVKITETFSSLKMIIILIPLK
ncbi:MAG: hypothetical protein EZS28_027624, partial [Streblomastix strix]